MRMLQYWRRNLEDFLHRNSGPFLLLCSLFVIGVIFGALAVRSISAKDKAELAAWLTGTLVPIQQLPTSTGGLMVKRALWGNAKLLALFWLLGISLVGAFGVMVVAFIRGVISGFVVGFMAAEMGGAGILLAVAGHLPQSLLEVPAILLAGTASVAFSMQFFRAWRERRRVPQFYRTLASYTGTLLATGVILIASSLVESYLSPALYQFTVTLVGPR